MNRVVIEIGLNPVLNVVITSMVERGGKANEKANSNHPYHHYHLYGVYVDVPYSPIRKFRKTTSRWLGGKYRLYGAIHPPTQSPFPRARIQPSFQSRKSDD